MSKPKSNSDVSPIELEEARQLCSTFQWMVIETSFPERIETLPAVRLKSNIMSVKKFQQSAGKGRAAQLFRESLDRFAGRLRLLENPDLRDQAEVGAIEKEAPDKQTFHTPAVEVAVERKLDEKRKSNDLATKAVHGEQQGAKAGERRVQSHIGSSNRRRQATRDSKNH